MAEPKVRFRRDDGGNFPAWEQGRFGDLIEVYDEKVTSDCTLPVLTSSKTDGIQYQSDHFGREQLHDITGYNVIPRGYCTYRNRSDGTDFTFNINNLCDRGIVSKFYPVFHTTARCNLYFLMTLMNNEPKTVRKIAMTAKGTGQKVLSFLDLQKIEINIPSLEEQQKIADFLSSVDDIITASEEEVANLETQKKAVMKKIFSQEVRFKRADGSDFPEWGRDVLDNFCEYRRGSFPQPYGLEEWYDENEGMPFIQVADVNDDMSVNPDTKRHISELAKPMSVFIPKGTLIITLQGTIGKVAITSYDAYVDRTLLLFQKVSDELLLDYFKYALFMCFDEEKKTADGGIIKTITKETLGSFVIPLPCIEEQRLIADFLSNFDEAISAAKKELELWKELKKGLLQQMFV